MLSLTTWIVGEWYLTVRCRSCGVEFAFLREADTDETAYLTDSNKIVLTCPDCHIPLAYSGEEIKRIQAQ
jgi:hypothetical protein